MNAISLNKTAAEGEVFDPDVYNADQTAIEDAINLLTQSADEGDSGADHIKTSPIIGTDAETVMDLFKYILSLGSGSLPGDGTISNDKLATDVKIGSLAALTTTAKSNIVAALNELVSSLSTDAGNLTSHAGDQTKHTDIMTTQGDMIAHNGSSPARLAKGTARQVLAMNSGATGQEWIASIQSLLTTQGDIPYASAANTPARLAKGTAYQQLAMNSGATAPEWAASLQSLMTAAGDILYASSANTPARLAKGTASQVLSMNSGATAPEWVRPVQFATGSYTGNGATNREISVGFDPKIVIVSSSGGFGLSFSGGSYGIGNSASGTGLSIKTSGDGVFAPQIVTGGFQVDHTTDSGSLNYNSASFTWIAVG